MPIGGKQRRPIDGCAPAIARFCDCKVWVSRDAVIPSYVFFGFEADVTLASYLFKVIDRAMCTEVATSRAAHPRLTGVGLGSASKGFQQGMAARVADRLTEMHRVRDASQRLIRYLRVPADTLFQSLHAPGIAADMQAKPVFIDDAPMRRARAGSPASAV